MATASSGTPAVDPVTDLAASSNEPVMTSVLYLGRHWRLLLSFVFVGLALGICVALRTSERYTSTASFLAISKSTGPSNISSLVGNLGLGGFPQEPEGPQFFADLFKTKELYSPVVREPLPAGGPDVRYRTLTELFGIAKSPPRFARTKPSGTS